MGFLSSTPKIRYAVVGLGHIAQAAVLPAFDNTKNSRLTALVSDDPEKRRELCEKYDLDRAYAYDEYEQCLRSGEIDAVYIALPNHLHLEYTVCAAEAGMHVLCEKPMAVTSEECEEMIATCRERQVKLMIAYRLHFEEANLKASEIVQSGQIGEPRIFNSLFHMQVKQDNIRVRRETGGGTLPDIGIYCINAARYLFRDEPTEVTAVSATKPGDPRFGEVEEMISAVLRFPGERLAQFTCSFGAADASMYQVVGTQGDLRVEPAYSYAKKIQHQLTIDGSTKNKTFRKRDHFAAELTYFSDCIVNNQEPEPSGKEGLIDVQIIEGLYESARSGRTVALDLPRRQQRPTIEQEIHRSPISEPELVHAEPPHD